MPGMCSSLFGPLPVAPIETGAYPIDVSLLATMAGDSASILP